MRHIFITILIAVSLAGCITSSLYQRRPDIPIQLSQSDVSERYGVIVGSFSRDPAGASSYTISLRNIDGTVDKEIFLQGDPYIASLNKLDDYDGGSLFVLRVPVGTYEIYDYSVFFNGGTWQKRIKPRHHFSIPFQVGSKQVVYVGEYAPKISIGKTILGTSTASDAILIQGDKWERDKIALNRRLPDFDWSKALRPKIDEKTGSNAVKTVAPS